VTGSPGTGKTHLAIALGVEAVKAGNSVHFSSLADLVASLSRAEREHTLRERVRYLSRHRLLIVDEIGYLPVFEPYERHLGARHRAGGYHALCVRAIGPRLRNVELHANAMT
jgi:DNA replication protein DnaC